MGWESDQLHYTYKVGTLRAIAENYPSLYSQEFFHPKEDLFSIALFKADFDLALRAIGKGYWTGFEDGLEGYSYRTRREYFKRYRYFGKAQRVVIAHILGITDRELSMMGFYGVPRLRGLAYRWMVDFLNG